MVTVRQGTGEEAGHEPRNARGGCDRGHGERIPGERGGQQRERGHPDAVAEVGEHGRGPEPPEPPVERHEATLALDGGEC